MGNGQSGALGNGTITTSITPVQVSGLTGVVSIGAGALRGFAVTADGALWAWGNGTGGGLGNGATTNSSVPMRVAGLTTVTSVTGGGASYALTRDGSVWAWGPNTFGQAGNGTTTNTLTPTRVVGLPAGITRIAAGTTTGYALDGSGELWSWGDMSEGQGALDPNLRSFVTTAAAANLLPKLTAIGSESGTGLGAGLP